MDDLLHCVYIQITYRNDTVVHQFIIGRTNREFGTVMIKAIWVHSNQVLGCLILQVLLQLTWPFPTVARLLAKECNAALRTCVLTC